MKTKLQMILNFCCSTVLLVAMGSGMLWASSQEDKSTKPQKGSAQFWSENCARCHNMQSPSSYNDKNWEIVIHQMRVRGDLTAEEHKKIAEFLKSGG